MVKPSIAVFIILLRGIRLINHLATGMLLAAIFPNLHPARQYRIIRRWNRKVLDILNIRIQIEGHLHYAPDNEGCMIVANHVSWLDVIVLNAIHPLRFIAKSEVASWPIIGQLCKRSGTIFIQRTKRRETAAINLQLSTLLKQGARIGLFPEGTTTDGKHVGHFHSSLIQPAIDAGVRLCPVALGYQESSGEISTAPVFTGETTLVQSIWNILRCPQLSAVVHTTQALPTANKNRRLLARLAQEAIADKLHYQLASQQSSEQLPATDAPQNILSPQSAYALLIDTQIQQSYK